MLGRGWYVGQILVCWLQVGILLWGCFLVRVCYLVIFMLVRRGCVGYSVRKMSLFWANKYFF